MPEAEAFTHQQTAAAVSVLCLDFLVLVQFYILSVTCTSFQVVLI